MFNPATKKVQGDHVKRQVPDIGMQETTAEKPIPLSTLYSRGIKDQVIHDLLVTEGRKRNKCRNNDNNERRGYFH